MDSSASISLSYTVKEWVNMQSEILFFSFLAASRTLLHSCRISSSARYLQALMDSMQASTSIARRLQRLWRTIGAERVLELLVASKWEQRNGKLAPAFGYESMQPGRQIGQVRPTPVPPFFSNIPISWTVKSTALHSLASRYESVKRRLRARVTAHI